MFIPPLLTIVKSEAMRRRLPLRFAAAAMVGLSLLSACASHRASDSELAAPPPTALTVHLVRHAEKASDDPKDPGLTDVGILRAERLAALLREDAVVAVYATGYRRTQATAAPTARARGLTIQTYDAAQAAADLAAQVRREHKGGALLVVGHSNTVASIAAALCDCEVAPLRDDEFDRWITVRIDANGAATLQTRRY
jgi:broad specificity phosphatase PhoE